MIWIIIILIILAIWFISYISDLKQKAYEESKEKVYNETVNNADYKNKVLNCNEILDKIGYKPKINTFSPYDSAPSVERIGICPKCKQGYLRIRKKFNGYSYGRYPQYRKYLGCSNFTGCNYTESYGNIEHRKADFKSKNIQNFKEDLEKAYS